MARQRHAVNAAHLHFLGGNSPFRAIKIELPPFGMPQLTGSNEEERNKPECRTHHRVAAISINGAQQATNRIGFDDRGAMGDLRRGKRASQIG